MGILSAAKENYFIDSQNKNPLIAEIRMIKVK